MGGLREARVSANEFFITKQAPFYERRTPLRRADAASACHEITVKRKVPSIRNLWNSRTDRHSSVPAVTSFSSPRERPRYRRERNKFFDDVHK